MKIELTNHLVTDPILCRRGNVGFVEHPTINFSVNPTDLHPLSTNPFLHAGARPYTPLKFVNISPPPTATEKKFQHTQEQLNIFGGGGWESIYLQSRVKGNGMEQVSP